MSIPMAIAQKLAFALITLLAPIAGIPVPTGTALSNTAQTAVVVNSAVVVTASSTATTTLRTVVALPDITANLLPQVHLAAHPIVLKPTPPKPSTSTVASVAKPTIAIKPMAPKPTAAITASAPKIDAGLPAVVTPQWIFDNTTLTLSQKLDGTFRVLLTTKAGNGQSISWHLTDTTIGGTAGLPQFGVSYSCSPVADIPDPSAPDQNIIFQIRTSYDCPVSLTPLSGSDRRMQTKDMSFTTGAGQLVVTAPSSMDTILRNDQNDGGFVFDNQDSQPITITGLTIDVSYAGLSVDSGPLVIRFADQNTGASLYDYHLENFPQDPAHPFTLSQAGVVMPLSFTIPTNGDTLLTIQALGVHKMSILGLDPTIKLVLRGVAMGQAGIKTILTLAQIQWSCIVTTQAYDPNATTGAFATGQACKD